MTTILPKRFGVHAPLSGGLKGSLQWAADATSNAIQIFSGNPSAWKGRPWSGADCAAFDERRRAMDITPCVLHTPYLINLATPDDNNWTKSKGMLSDALAQATRSGSEYVNSHIGSHLGSGMDAGVARVAEALREVLSADGSGVVVLLETTNGSGNLVGSHFDELAAVLDACGPVRDRVGVCIDTAHIWAAGYDISSEESTTAVIDDFDRQIGLDKLLCIHANDNRRAFNGKSDVHQDIGEGEIGPAAFRALVNDTRLAHVPFILETPKENPGDDRRNLDVLRGYQV
ncbi:MAG TPA: deoxyribonuclease IV [Armatimonadota bacterium]|jgi:deoxyribonuclease-4